MRPRRFRDAGLRPCASSEREPHPAILGPVVLRLADLLLGVQACIVTGGIRRTLSLVGTFSGLRGEGDVYPLRSHCTRARLGGGQYFQLVGQGIAGDDAGGLSGIVFEVPDRKSTRLNSSHANISYAVFCLKKHTSTY